jgi:hypothetical protein
MRSFIIPLIATIALAIVLLTGLSSLQRKFACLEKIEAEPVGSERNVSEICKKAP